MVSKNSAQLTVKVSEKVPTINTFYLVSAIVNENGLMELMESNPFSLFYTIALPKRSHGYSEDFTSLMIGICGSNFFQEKEHGGS